MRRRHVPLGPAPLERRMLAAAMDAGLLGAATWLFLGALDIEPPLGVLLWVGAAYHCTLVGWRGASIGQRLLGLVVLDRTTGERIGVRRAFGRYGLRCFASLVVVPLVLAVVALRRDTSALPLWDRWSGTVVVRLGSAEQLAEVLLEAIGPAAAADEAASG